METKVGHRAEVKSRVPEEVEVAEPRVGKTCRVVYTVVRFEKVVRAFTFGQWKMFEVETETGERRVVGEYQVKGEVDEFMGV